MWLRVERSCGKLMRRFRLPENAKMDPIKGSIQGISCFLMSNHIQGISCLEKKPSLLVMIPMMMQPAQFPLASN